MSNKCSDERFLGGVPLFHNVYVKFFPRSHLVDRKQFGHHRPQKNYKSLSPAVAYFCKKILSKLLDVAAKADFWIVNINQQTNTPFYMHH